jgi:pimeloyl-ACP methyl ester carboxylesterase
VKQEPDTRNLGIGYFGASTGAAASLAAAAQVPDEIRAVVSRGGRTDLAGDAIDGVTAPTLLIVGAFDYPVTQCNQETYHRLTGVKHLAVIGHATHLFQEPHALEQVAELAGSWFAHYLPDQPEETRNRESTIPTPEVR